MTIAQIIGASGLAVLAISGFLFMAATIGWKDTAGAVGFSLALTGIIMLLTGLLTGNIG